MTDIPRYGQVAPQGSPCPRHLDRKSLIRCQRCGLVMCPECQVQRPVGIHCVDCVNQERKSLPRVKKFFPVVTWTLIAICGALAVLTQFFPILEYLLVFSPLLGYYDWYRFLTSAFLHAGLLHLLANMFALYLVGPSLERALGRIRYTVLYLSAAWGGSLAVLLWAYVVPESFRGLTVGASGAVFGLFAAIFVLQKRSGADTKSVLILLGINLAFGFVVPQISWQGHLGGMLTGLLVTYLLVKSPKRIGSGSYATLITIAIFGTLFLATWGAYHLLLA